VLLLVSVFRGVFRAWSVTRRLSNAERGGTLEFEGRWAAQVNRRGLAGC